MSTVREVYFKAPFVVFGVYTVFVGEDTYLLVALLPHQKYIYEHILSTRAKVWGKTSTQVLEHCFAQNNDSSGSVQQCAVYACYPLV